MPDNASPRNGRQTLQRRCRPLRGLWCFSLEYPGVPLGFTPGFMLSPAPQAQLHTSVRSLTPHLYSVAETLLK
jgi:hypothetical protein